MARVTFDLRSVTIGPHDGPFTVTLNNPGDAGVKEAHVVAYFQGDQRVVLVTDPRILVLGPNNRPLANAAAGGRAEAFAAVAARLEDHDPQDTVDALASDAASLVDRLNTALREAGADVPQLQDVDLVKAKHAMMALVDAERQRGADRTAGSLQTEALVAELKARGAVAIEWAADDGPRREGL